VIVAAITSRLSKRNLPTHFLLDGVEGLPDDSILLLEQIRTIDKQRLKEWLTQLDDNYMEEIVSPLLISIGVKNKR
jgi:mRNA interferase MazF